MGCVLEILVEFLFELFGEGFFDLSSAYLPGRLSPKAENVLRVVFVLLAGVLLCGLFVGIAFLVESGGHSVWGWLLLGLGVLYILAGIVLKIVSHCKKK